LHYEQCLRSEHSQAVGKFVIIFNDYNIDKFIKDHFYLLHGRIGNVKFSDYLTARITAQ